MNFKFLLAIALILCAFCVLPVNANAVISFQEGTTLNLGDISDNILTVEYVYYTQSQCIIYELYVNDQLVGNNIPADEYVIGNYYKFKWDIPLDENSNSVSTYFKLAVAQQGLFTYSPMTLTYNYVPPVFPDRDYDIDIDLQENIINLGVINSLDRTFIIGSSSDRVVKQYTSYSAMSCSIDNIEKTYVKVHFDENFNYSEINLNGYALLNDVQSDFNTHVEINYIYMPASDITAYIQTWDYNTGNMVSGVNMSVYEVIDHGTYAELGTKIYSSISAESQTILQVKNNTDYFVINDLTGYFAVKNTEYPYFNGLTGYWWSSPAQMQNTLLLYYSKLDPTAQYNANFIVHDTNQNGISGVSVTMDNSQTLITNNIGSVSFQNVSAGQHSFTFVKNGYQSAQRTINIQMQYASFDQVLFKDNQIINPTISPTAYPTISPTLQPTISPIDHPTNLAESVKYGLSKIFGVNSVNSINLIFALMIILFPAVIGGVITNQALGFVSGGMIGFVFGLALDLIPLWVFFSMVMLAVIYLVLTKGSSEGF